jgi:hypothetical protein
MEGLPAQRMWSRLACAGLNTRTTAGQERLRKKVEFAADRNRTARRG